MILIIDNNNNILFYEKVVEQWKERSGPEALFLVFSKAKHRYLQDRGLNSVYLKRSEPTLSDVKERIASAEHHFKEFSFAQCIANDRILKHYPYPKAERILFDYASRFLGILEKNDIRMIMGEITWGVELLFYRLANHEGIDYVDPLNLYASSELRLTFFDAGHTSRYMEKIARMKINENETVDHKRIIQNRKSEDINQKLGSKLRALGYEKWLRKISFLLKFRDSYDYRYSPVLKRKRILQLLNKKIIGIFRRLLYAKQPPREPYFYFPLHIQPEATPDIVSLYYNDQVHLIRQLSKSLPIGSKLVIKEHPNGVGSRSAWELYRIGGIENVILVDHDTPSKNLIENSQGVVTVAGTAAIEARYMNKPALVFSDIYFRERLNHIYRCYDFNQLPNFLKKFLSDTDFTETNMEAFVEWVHTSSFDCYIYDPFIDPEVLSNTNVTTFSKAVHDFYRSIR